MSTDVSPERGGELGVGRHARDPDARFRALVEASPDGVLVAGADGRISFVNARLEEMSGYRREQLIGQPVEILVPAPDQVRHAGLRRGYGRSPRSRMMGKVPDLSLRRRDGSHCPVEIALAPVTHAESTATVAMVRDVTGQRARERERAGMLRTLNLVPDAVLVIDASTMIVEYANQAVEALTGYSADAVVGRPVGELIPGLGADNTTRAGVDHPGRVGRGERQHARIRTSSGEQVPVQLNQRRVSDDTGAIRVVALVTDLRPRLAQEERLGASEQAFRTLFEQAPIGVAVISPATDGSGTVVLANQTLADMFACPVSEIIGRDFAGFSLAEDQAGDRELLARMARGTVHQFSRLKRYRRLDGTWLWAEVRATNFALPELPGPLMLGHWLDVTTRIEQQVREAREGALNRYVAEVTRGVLADQGVGRSLDLVATAATELLDADASVLFLQNSASGLLRATTAHGDLLAPLLHSEIPVPDSPPIARLRTDQTVTLMEPAGFIPDSLAPAIGPVAICQLDHAAGGPLGYLLVARHQGGLPFTPEDATYLGRLSTQTRLALNLANTRVAQQRLALLEDRQRIARELHDSVIQDIIALGMQIAATADRESDADRQSGYLQTVTSLEEAVRQLRRIVFEMRVPPSRDLSTAVADLAGEAARVLGHRPELSLIGPLDRLPPRTAEDLLGVVREALSNVARHAAASRTRVTVQVDDSSVTVTVEDDGHGMPANPRRGQGITNIEHRAYAYHGSAVIGGGPLGGTRLTWSCPVPGSIEDPA